MLNPQTQKIYEILQDERWHCVNEFIDTYSVDYRRRLVDLKRKGYQLISRKCLRHQHRGGSKEWRFTGMVEQPLAANHTFIDNPLSAKEFLKRFPSEEEVEKVKNTLF